jgi:hypothetical protein
MVQFTEATEVEPDIRKVDPPEDWPDPPPDPLATSDPREEPPERD